jgi:hypothetical protein
VSHACKSDTTVGSTPPAVLLPPLPAEYVLISCVAANAAYRQMPCRSSTPHEERRVEEGHVTIFADSTVSIRTRGTYIQFSGPDFTPFARAESTFVKAFWTSSDGVFIIHDRPPADSGRMTLASGRDTVRFTVGPYPVHNGIEGLIYSRVR